HLMNRRISRQNHYKQLQREARKPPPIITKEFPNNLRNKHLLAGVASMVGRRSTMEDGHVLRLNFRKQKDEVFAGVYDGHGGPEAAQCVAKYLHEIFAQKLNLYFNELK